MYFSRFSILFFSALFLVLLITPCFSQQVFPYARAILKVPVMSNPFPGLGTYYSSLGDGIETVLWNPAHLGKVSSMNLSLDLSQEPAEEMGDKFYDVEDIEFGFGNGDSQYQKNYVLFTDDPQSPFQKERKFVTYGFYQTKATDVQYKQAISVNDMFTFGISTFGNAGAELNIIGDLPALYKSEIDLTDSGDFMGTGFLIDDQNHLTITKTLPGGGTYTYTSEAEVWDGFVNQERTIPFSAQVRALNNLEVKTDLIFTCGYKNAGLSLGANLIPIQATAQIDNTVDVGIDEDASDFYFYTPDFDVNNENEIIEWTTDPNKYGSVNGYKKKYVRVPVGETIARAKYSAHYSASTSRVDLGLTYDLKDIATVGLVYENVTGASLNFEGSGFDAFAITRVSTTGPQSGFIDPTSDVIWDPFTDEFTEFEEAKNMSLLSRIDVPLPQKLRYGITFKKPILVVIDFEQQLNSFSFGYTDDDGPKNIEIGNVRFLRFGLESQILFLPVFARFGTSFMLKPDVKGLKPEDQEWFDDNFLLMMPVKLDLGAIINFWGYHVGGYGKFSVNPVTQSLLQLDVLNSDVNQMIVFGLFVEKDYWRINYTLTADPASGIAYSNLTTLDKEDLSINEILNTVRWVQTLSFGIKF